MIYVAIINANLLMQLNFLVLSSLVIITAVRNFYFRLTLLTTPDGMLHTHLSGQNSSAQAAFNVGSA